MLGRIQMMRFGWIVEAMKGLRWRMIQIRSWKWPRKLIIRIYGICWRRKGRASRSVPIRIKRVVGGRSVREKARRIRIQAMILWEGLRRGARARTLGIPAEITAIRMTWVGVTRKLCWPIRSTPIFQMWSRKIIRTGQVAVGLVQVRIVRVFCNRLVRIFLE
jgi:hypothetical protein